MAIIHKMTTGVGEDVGKGNSCALLVGIYIGAATLESSIEVPQKYKKKMRVTISTAAYSARESKNSNYKTYMHPRFIGTLIIVKIWKQPKCYSKDTWIKKI